MKWLCRVWIQPLQKRVREDLAPENGSFSRAWSVVVPILIYYVVNVFCISLFAAIVRWGALQGEIGNAFSEWIKNHSFMVSGVVNGMAMLAGAGMVYPMFQKETPEIGLAKKYRKDIFLLMIVGALAALCLNVLFSLLQITGSSETYAKVAEKQFAFPLWTGILLYGIVSPFAEELVFRGVVYNRLRRQFGLTVAVFGSALVFGLYHANPVQTLYGFLQGILMAVLYERYGAFVVPVVLHSAANICVYVITSGGIWQQHVLKPLVCVVSGGITILLLWLMLRHREKAVEE